MTRTHRKLIPFFALCLLLAPLYQRSISAAPLNNLSDQLDRINEATTSGHTIKFVIPGGVTAGSTIQVTAAAGFAFGSSYDFNDMGLAQGSTGNCSTATFTPVTLASTPSGATWGAALSSQTVTFTSGTGTITAGRCVRVLLNSNGVNHTLTNPTVTSNTSYTFTVQAGMSPEVGYLGVVILNDTSTPDADQIRIDAQVVNTLNFDVDVVATNCNNSTETASGSNIINFGSLAPGVAEFSTGSIPFVCLDVGSSAASGITVYIQSARANAAGGLVRNPTGTIVSATANLNSGGVTSGYGARVSSTGTPAIGTFTATSPFNNGSAGNVGLVPGTGAAAASLVSSSGPAQTGASSRIAVEIGAKAGVDTPAGFYTDTLTFTATATF